MKKGCGSVIYELAPVAVARSVPFEELIKSSVHSKSVFRFVIVSFTPWSVRAVGPIEARSDRRGPIAGGLARSSLWSSSKPSSTPSARCTSSRAEVDLLNLLNGSGFAGIWLPTFVSSCGWDADRCRRRPGWPQSVASNWTLLKFVKWMQHSGSDTLLPVFGSARKIHEKHSCFEASGVNELALKKLLNGSKKEAGGWS